MRTYYIYKATNLINGKCYIGQTVDFRSRVWEHLRCYERNDCKFHDAIKEFGRDNFDFEILKTVNSAEEADYYEKFYIKEYDTYHNGYNMNKGGVGGHNASAVVCLEYDGTYVCRYDSAQEAEREGGYCNSDVLLCCKNLQHHCRDKIFMFEEDYIKYGAKKYSKPEPKGMKAIIQCDTEGKIVARYKSVMQAAKETGIRRSRISANLIGDSKTAGGFIFVYEGEYDKLNVEEHRHKKKGRKVAQIDPDTGDVIAIYDRMADAGRALGVSYKGIHGVVDNPNRKAFGFKWVTVKEEEK